MTADQMIALASVMIVGLIGLLTLLGWVVTILMKIQTELARLNAEVVGMQSRLLCIERMAIGAPQRTGSVST